MDVLFWGPLVRICQAAVACAPTLVIGWLIAAIFERILGREGTFRLFGGRSWRQLPYAWLLGMLLPVCSFGVIPIMVQMRRSGISGGTIIAFGLTAPLFNPISVLYGLTLSDPFTLFVFCLGSLSIITVIGVVWDRFFSNNWLEPETLPPTPYGLRRVVAVALSMAEQAFSRSSYYIFVALLGVGLLAGLLPAGILQHAAGSNDPTAPLTMCGIATLAYVTPMVAIVQVASMFQHGNSIGASFTLLVMGTGVNLGLLMWSVKEFGLKKTLFWFALLAAVVLAISYGVNGPLHPKGVQSADHTHAFDGYCNPFILNATNVPASAIQTVRDSTKLEDVIAGIAALVLLAVGGIRRRFDPQQKLMGFLTKRAEGIAKVSNDIILPNSVIAAVTLVGLVLASIGACFLYYQPVNEIKKEMTALQADLFSSVAGREWDTAAFLIVQQEDWAHKLVVGQYLRRQSLNRFQKMRMKVFLSKLELLEHACEDRDAKEADHWNRQVNTSLNRFKKSLESN
jgi:uncharacterized protein